MVTNFIGTRNLTPKPRSGKTSGNLVHITETSKGSGISRGHISGSGGKGGA